MKKKLSLKICQAQLNLAKYQLGTSKQLTRGH